MLNLYFSVLSYEFIEPFFSYCFQQQYLSNKIKKGIYIFFNLLNKCELTLSCWLVISLTITLQQTYFFDILIK